jgi:putative CocE/NonD family hydrolase
MWPSDEPSDLYLVNPIRPVHSVGGQVILTGATAMGSRDQREVEVRDDVLVYTSPFLEQPVEVVGPIELRLWAFSSAPNTDFTGKLVDVHPDGRATILTDGILRAGYRNSPSAPELMEPGTPYELSLDLWATANVFLPGRIRLEVSSSNFPKVDRNSKDRRRHHQRNRRPVPARGQPHPARPGPPIATDPPHCRALSCSPAHRRGSSKCPPGAIHKGVMRDGCSGRQCGGHGTSIRCIGPRCV